MVIGIDGLSGVGKTSTAKLLCENNECLKYIELGDLCRKILPFWIKLKEEYDVEYIIEFMKKIEISYKINNNIIDFTTDKNIPSIKCSKSEARKELYNMVQIEEIKKKIDENLVRIINELKDKYIIVIVGRELQKIYPDLDYHFYLKADEADRIERIMQREQISEKEAKERKIEEVLHSFGKDVITINTSRMNLIEVVKLIQNVLNYKYKSFKKIKIQFMGAQSTGKTTTSKFCAEKFNEPYVGEKLRYCMEQNKLKFSDILLWNKNKWSDIISSQLQSEKELKNKAKKFVFADSAALLYAIDFDLLKYSEIKNLIDEQLTSAGMVFVCDNEIPYIEDEIRPSRSESNIELCQYKIINYLNEMNIPYIILSGSVEERIKTIEQIINRIICSVKK